MSNIWFGESCTQLKADAPSDINVGYQETHAQNIFEKYYTLDKVGANVDTSLYGGKERITQEWLSTVLRRGTSTDRVLALAFLVKSKPMSSLRHLDSLLSFISPAKKQTCLKAIDILTNLFESFLLPTKRALISFEDRPFDQLEKYQAVLESDLTLKAKASKSKGTELPRGSREHVLTLWYFENQLKQVFFRFLTALENILMSDTIAAEKTKALNALLTLISKKPENREAAVGILVNKLGDRSKGFASSIIYKLRTLCTEQPHLKGILVEQLRCLLFRPNLVDRAKYYAIVFLSCIPLSKRNAKSALAPSGDEASGGDSSIAAILFKVYLSFFRASVSADELPERLVTALLTGISRVAPYLSDAIMTENVTDIDAVFRLVHITSNFTISLQTLTFLFHFTEHQPQLRDRYYQALYRKLTDQAVRWSSRGPSLLNLVYRSLLADRDAERRAAVMQRLLSVCLDHPNAGFVAGCQILLEKLRAAAKAPITLTVNGQSSSGDAAISAAKKLLPVSVGLVKQSHGDSDSEEEHFSDVAGSDDDDDEDSEKEGESKDAVINKPTSSWDHKTLLKKAAGGDGSGAMNGGSHGYDTGVRDPRFAKALSQPCWQLILLTGHAHPTVSLFAHNAIESKAFKYTGDPFDDLSVAHFMERFVYKKPKPTTKTVAQPGKAAAEANKKKAHAKTLAPDSLAYKNLSAEQVPSDERFIHDYFNFITTKPQREEGDGSESSSDESELLDADFDDYLRKHEKGLIPDDLNEDDDVDEEFNYSTDEEEEKEDKPTKKSKAKKAKPSEDEEDDQESFSNSEDEGSSEDGDMSMDDEKGSDDEEEGGDGEGMSTDDDEEESGLDSEDDFAPSSKRGEKFDLNKLFVSADEVGELYDSQDAPGKSSKRGQFKGGKRPAFGGSKTRGPAPKRRR